MIIRSVIEENENTTRIPIGVAQDVQLSYRAIGVLAAILAGAKISAESLSGESTEGRDAVRSALTELEKAGYLVRERIRNERSELENRSYIFLDKNPKSEPTIVSSSVFSHFKSQGQTNIEKLYKSRREKILEAYGSNCHLCGEAINLEAPRYVGRCGWELGLHVDHVIPRAKGGRSNFDNLRPAHAICNMKKGSKLMGETK